VRTVSGGDGEDDGEHEDDAEGDEHGVGERCEPAVFARPAPVDEIPGDGGGEVGDVIALHTVDQSLAIAGLGASAVRLCIPTAGAG
jgi:hypothetical protein